LGLCLLFGASKFAVLRDAFSNNPLNYYPIAKKIMSRRRFAQLQNCFSVEYSEKIEVAKGPMKKIEPVYTMLIDHFQKVFYPYIIELSLDESLLLHRGRLGFRQSIKGKSKVWHQTL